MRSGIGQSVRRAAVGLVLLVGMLPLLLSAAPRVGGRAGPAGVTGHDRPAPPPGVVPSWCERTAGGYGYRCLAGPVVVGGDSRVEFFSGIAAPSQPGYFTAARATLVDSSGEPVPHDQVHLHHAVWLNPYRRDMTCTSYDAGLPAYERFFASGGERTPVVLPEGYGYHWDPPLAPPISDPLAGPVGDSTPYMVLVAMLDGLEGSPDTFVELDLEFVPQGDAGGMVGIKPVWLDVRNCSSHPVYTVEQGSGSNGLHAERWTYRMPATGRFVFLGGHLHGGGLELRLANRTTGQDLFTSLPTYGMPGQPWMLTGMSTWADPHGVGVSQGDILELTAVYDSSRRWEDVMGIMLGALVPRGAPVPPG